MVKTPEFWISRTKSCHVTARNPALVKGLTPLRESAVYDETREKARCRRPQKACHPRNGTVQGGTESCCAQRLLTGQAVAAAGVRYLSTLLLTITP